MTFIRRTLTYLLIVVGTVIVNVLAYCLVVAAIAPPRHHSGNVEMFKEGSWAFEGHPQLGAVPIAGGHGRSDSNGKTFDYYYGAFGNRVDGPTEAARGPNPAAELVLVGSSNAWGQGIENEEVASSVIARSLGIEALNLSVPGTGTAYSARRLELLPQLTPRVILYMFWGDHIYRNVRRCAPVDNPLCPKLIGVERGRDGHMQYYFPSYLIEDFLGGVFSLVRSWYLDQYDGSGRTSYWKDVFWVMVDSYVRIYKAMFHDPHVDASDKRKFVVEALDFAIARIAGYARERDAVFVVVYVPSYAYPARLELLPDDLRRVLTKNDALVIDMAPKFNVLVGMEPKDRGNYLFAIPNDGHISALGHRMIAEEVIAALSAKGHLARVKSRTLQPVQ